MQEPPKPSSTELLLTLIAVQKKQAEILAHHDQCFGRIIGICEGIRTTIIVIFILACLVIPSCEAAMRQSQAQTNAAMERVERRLGQ
jgi:hypothetical protein